MLTFDDYEEWTVMACAEYEDRILEWQEGALPAAERRAVEEHLAACAGCRQFAEELTHLDAALARTLQVPRLPAQFKSRLLQRVDASRPMVARETITARKQQVESEFQAFLAGLRQRVWRANFAKFLDGLGVAGLVLVGIAMAQPIWQRAPELTAALPAALVNNPAQLLLWASTAAGLLVGVVFGVRRQAARWAEML
ncbi:MAG: zf-HC2 domain-containing protein [Verrucomicrobia bacterium]|nr:zf-HC2 domain-containing protein [Verrucomicrobiota bacterium]